MSSLHLRVPRDRRLSSGLLMPGACVLPVRLTQAALFLRVFCGYSCPSIRSARAILLALPQRIAALKWPHWMPWMPWMPWMHWIASDGRGNPDPLGKFAPLNVALGASARTSPRMIDSFCLLEAAVAGTARFSADGESPPFHPVSATSVLRNTLLNGDHVSEKFWRIQIAMQKSGSGCQKIRIRRCLSVESRIRIIDLRLKLCGVSRLNEVLCAGMSLPGVLPS